MGIHGDNVITIFHFPAINDLVKVEATIFPLNNS
jgi:hypothetical protein